MGFWILIGFFTAYGIVCTLLTLYGMILYRGSRTVEVFLLIPKQEKKKAYFFRWLKEMGIIRCRLFTVEASELMDQIEKNAAEIITRAYSPGDDRSGRN